MTHFDPNDAVLIFPSKPPNYHYQRFTIEQAPLIESLHPQAVALLTSFCINQWLAEKGSQASKETITNKMALSYWIENGSITQLNYDCLRVDTTILSEAIWAIAFDWLVIVLLQNNYELMQDDPAKLLSRQLKFLIQLAKHHQAKGLTAQLTNPNLYEVFIQHGFKRDLKADTGLPIPFRLTF